MLPLSDIVDTIRRFYDPAHEPLRRRVYTTLLALAALAVTVGLVAGSAVTAITGPLALLLAVPAVESARSQVTPKNTDWTER
ncbi:hypothetical protein [Amycolatopsis sp. PS_44_ISF1]|uniref:hypothetical protein n=1 Tax=Amycolatopsis sp. PS_44_ISF1 TaxID=2974917 RepID=UPI0028DE0230|nr:hypothetical protein [Amycolatopsis sp. PS_44_ISF1]MDT8915770.1 hypothetical protein [Amycolatopsis sp. PS_44_ISF1]MDT8916286.1 hypothetical protein [Amycolatopsis sp. PS_44_ISF1]MDT8916311.1 hypothetical protein [Amycolatopsis sp. PS_44_ISF1]MDT8916359.1 hypothetical protein [Amycolatopsis sp. PS_44_ISF1]